MNPYDVGDWDDFPNPVADDEYRKQVIAEIAERRRLTGGYSLHDTRDPDYSVWDDPARDPS